MSASLPGSSHANGRDHGVVVQILAELDVLLEQPGDASDQRFQLRPCVHLEVESLDHGAEIAFVFADRNNLAALHAFHQNLDIAVGQLQALDDVRDRTHADKSRPAAARRREASCWVARKIFLSPASASSSARTLDSRPTTKGVIMCGKMTTSRMGIIGKRRVSDFSLEVSIEDDYRVSFSSS